MFRDYSINTISINPYPEPNMVTRPGKIQLGRLRGRFDVQFSLYAVDNFLSRCGSDPPLGTAVPLHFPVTPNLRGQNTPVVNQQTNHNDINLQSLIVLA